MLRSVAGVAALAAALTPGAAGADPLRDIAQCAQISSNELRLICYDTAAATLGNLSPASAAPPPAPAMAAETAPPAPTPAMAPAAPAEAAPAAVAAREAKSGGSFFGLFGGKKKAAPAPAAPASSASPEADFGAERLPMQEDGKPKAPSSIRAAITDYAYTPFDRIIVFLDNGQVWRQLEGDGKKLRLRKGQSYTAEIEKGVLGSYNLTIEGVSGMAKVTRVK